MKTELTGKIALVTGSSRGIGRATAVALAKAGADVAVNDVRQEAEARAVCVEVEALGRRALAVKADVSKAAEVARLLETVEKGLGSIDILMNNAGISRPQSLSEITEQDWDDVLSVNLKSMFLVTSGCAGDAATQMGQDYQPVLRGGATRRCHWASLRRLQGRSHWSDARLRISACQGRHHGKRDCPGDD
jgi:NAD(P)-dependent dehydrogenase (short-subunit alcohol dehydrogenase family)